MLLLDAKRINAVASRRMGNAKRYPGNVAKKTTSLHQPPAMGPTVGQQSDKIQLVFVGTLGLDGQKSIWNAQFHGLDRMRFDRTFVAFETHNQRKSGGVNKGVTGNNPDESFVAHLKHANVSLLRVSIPPVHRAGIVDTADAAVGTLAQDLAHVTSLLRRDAVTRMLHSGNDA
jgi:hypothetical protein